jgi:putative serine/threonine protein kinase
MTKYLDFNNFNRFRDILTYPKFEEEIYKTRLRELIDLGVGFITSGGATRVRNTNIIGKGSVGLVIKAKRGRRTLALKIRRVDANRNNMYEEVFLHSAANSIGIGPIIIDYSENFILMEFINGFKIIDLYKKNLKPSKLRKLMVTLLEQCFRMDQIGLDHGQLSNLNNHVIVSRNIPVIIDFETSSMKRKSNNVTSAVQSLLMSGQFSNKLTRLNNAYDTKVIIRLLKEYKEIKSRDRFEKITEIFS